MVSRTCVSGFLGFCLLLGISGLAVASQETSSPVESPRVMRIGGVLKDAQGGPRSGTQHVTFSIYAEPEGGSSVWAETQDVSVGGNARYEVLLGSSRAEGFPIELLASGKLLWLGIQVGEEPEQRPRVMLVSVAHALKADDAATLSGKALSELVQVEQLKTPEGRKQLGLRPMATTDDVFTATADPGPGFISQATSGPPLQVSSSGKVDNLNVDLLDDLDSTAFAQLSAANTFTADQTIIGANLSLGGTLTLPSSVLVQAGADRFLHNNSGLNNTFLGVNAGNLTMTGVGNTASGADALFSNTTGIFNTASGRSALFSNTTGSGNTASGVSALISNTTGNNNTAIGEATLGDNTTGSNNTASGARALLFNTTGSGNTASGSAALFFNTTGIFNTASGFNALRSNTTGINNTASGAQALFSNTTGIFNTASGFNALRSNTTGNDNTASGSDALRSNTTGSANTASGTAALRNNTTGIVNTAVGRSALANNTTGNDNTASGVQALFSNIAGNANTASGAGALAGNTSGDSNTANGRSALESNTMGHRNTASGVQALFSNTTGSDNIAIGQAAGANLTTGDANIHVGNAGFAGEGFTIRIGVPQTRTFIAGIRGVTTGQPNAIPVLIDSNGQLGTASSSARFKEDIQDMREISSGLLKLRPVTFRYRGSQGNARHFGLIAEEVEEVLPELVVHTPTGEAETVLYHEMPAMLLNELQKQQRRIAQQDAEISNQRSWIKQQEAKTSEQQRWIKALEARLAELEGSDPRTDASGKQ